MDSSQQLIAIINNVILLTGRGGDELSFDVPLIDADALHFCTKVPANTGNEAARRLGVRIDETIRKPAFNYNFSRKD